MNAIELSSYVGLTALTLLTMNILLGMLLSIKYNPVRNWPHRRINTVRLHNWTAYAALVMSLVHPVLLLVSPTAHFRVLDLVFPLGAPKQPYINTLGALAVYVLVVTVVTSYFRVRIGRRTWKVLHFATYALFVLYAVHALLTDPNLKDAAFDPFDAEKVFVELCIVLVLGGIVLRVRWQQRRAATLLIAVALLPLLSALLRAQSTLPTAGTTGASAELAAQVPQNGWRYAQDAGAVYQRGDFTWTLWGFAERAWGPHSAVVSADAWRRVRQGMEVDFPRLSSAIRPTFVYEVDLTDNAFFRTGRASQVFENLYVAIQHPNDASRFRLLVGENTHIISREDNLSSGNLPTINRSLILEEHGSVNSFGTQWGVEAFRQVTSRISLALAAQDNRGSLNSTQPRFRVGNSLAAKVTTVALRDTVRRRQLTFGAGVDYTRAIVDRTFTLASALGAQALGGTSATGNKVTIEGDVAYTWMAGAHVVSLEGEFLFSDFSHSLTDVSGGYAMLQSSLVDDARWGDIDPFVRVDVVRLNREMADGAADQRAVRVGVNYNLPSLDRHLNVHVEYAHNRVTGPMAMIVEGRAFGEARVELRLSASRYVRH